MMSFFCKSSLGKMTVAKNCAFIAMFKLDPCTVLKENSFDFQILLDTVPMEFMLTIPGQVKQLSVCAFRISFTVLMED